MEKGKKKARKKADTFQIIWPNTKRTQKKIKDLKRSRKVLQIKYIINSPPFTEHVRSRSWPSLYGPATDEISFPWASNIRGKSGDSRLDEMRFLEMKTH